MPVSLPVLMPSSTRADAVSRVDVSRVGAPALGGGRQVGDPQDAAAAVPGLEQTQLRAGIGPLAAGEHAHPLGPAGHLVMPLVRPQDPGQLGDVGFLDPAPAVGALPVCAGIPGVALADLAPDVDGDLPRGLGDKPVAARSRSPSSHPTE